MRQQREEAAQTEQDPYQQSYRQQPYQQTSPYAPQTGSRYLPSAEQLAYKRQILQPMRATVRGRVSFYARRTKSWQELEMYREKFPVRTPEQSRKLISCQSKVSALYEAYTALQLQLFDDRNLTDSREQIMMSLQNLQNRDFTYLAGECPSLFKQLSAQSSAQPERIVPSEEAANPTTPDPMTTGHDVFQPEQPDFSTPDVNQPDVTKPDFNNYPQNPTQYGQPVNSRPADLFSPAEPPPNYEERYQQAQSLLKQGREQDARRILSDLLASARQTGNRTLQIKILKKISELELALRNYLPARILYEELQQLNAPFDKQHLAALQSIDSQREKVDAYAALLLSAMRSNPERDGFTVVQQARAFVQNFPDSPLRSNVENLEAKVELEAEQWFQGLLRQFDRLAANQQHQEALALLEHVPLDILPLDKQDIIQQRKDSLTILTMPSPPVQADSPPSPTTAFPDVSVTGNIRKEVRNQQNTDQLNQLNQLKAVNQVQPAAMTQNVRQEVQEQPNTDQLNQLNQLKTVNQVQPAAMTQNVRQEVQEQPNTDQLNQLKTVNQVQARQPAQQPVQPAEPSVPKETKRSETKRLPGNKEKFSGSSERLADTVVQKKWNQAEAAFRAAEYDKAITLYTALLNTSLDTQARRKMEKASLAAGQEARRKAANFFQRANSATDPETRKQHLLSSKMLLEDILQKYPLAGLDTKVKRNLSRVDKELSALDHTPFE